MASIANLYQPREHEEKIRAHFGDLAIRPDAPPVAEAITIMIFVNRYSLPGSGLCRHPLR
jgi:hypothetical protein